MGYNERQVDIAEDIDYEGEETGAEGDMLVLRSRRGTLVGIPLERVLSVDEIQN